MTAPLHARIRDRLGQDVLEWHDFRGDATFLVRTQSLPGVARALKELGFEVLMDVCAVDHHPAQHRFEVVYHFLSLEHNARLRVKVRAPEERAVVPSLAQIYPAANWAEREAYDLVGVSFEGHPDLRRIFMPEEWPGHPLQRTHPLGYEEVQFSHNFKRIDEAKPYAKG